MITDTCNCGAAVTIDYTLTAKYPEIDERASHADWLKAHAICREHPLITIDGEPIPAISLPHTGGMPE